MPKTSSSHSSRRAVLEQFADVPVVVQRPVPMVQSVHLPVVSTVAVHRKGPRCLRCVPRSTRLRISPGEDFWTVPYSALSLVRQWIHFPVFPFSAQRLVFGGTCNPVSHGGNLDEFPKVSYVKDPEVDSRPTPKALTSLLSLVVPRCRASTGVPSPIRVSSACAQRLWYRRRCRCWCGLRVDTACFSRELHAVHWHVELSGRRLHLRIIRYAWFYVDTCTATVYGGHRSSPLIFHVKEDSYPACLARQGGFGSISHVFCVKTEARILTSIPALLVRRG